MSATVQDILSRHYMLHKTYDNLADKIAIHLNDTHPVLSIPELMRLLIDEHKFSWDEAFGGDLPGFLLYQPHPDERSARELAGGYAG